MYTKYACLTQVAYCSASASVAPLLLDEPTNSNTTKQCVYRVIKQ